MHDINFKGIHIRTIFDLTYLIKKSNDMVSQMARSKVTLPFNGAKLFNSFENEFKNGLNYSEFKAKLKTIVMVKNVHAIIVHIVGRCFCKCFFYVNYVR